MVPIAPGNSPEFTAAPTPNPSNANSAVGTPPIWSLSDTTVGTLAIDSTGLVATLSVGTNAQPGTSFTIAVSYTNPDGVLATGSATFTVSPATAIPDTTSFTITQTA